MSLHLLAFVLNLHATVSRVQLASRTLQRVEPATIIGANEPASRSGEQVSEKVMYQDMISSERTTMVNELDAAAPPRAAWQLAKESSQSHLHPEQASSRIVYYHYAHN